MAYLMFKHEGSAELDANYREALGLYALGVHKAGEYLRRALQLMAPQDRRHQHGVLLPLARHVAEEVDAISILLEKGCVEPCKAHLRSAFEAALGIGYILETDSDRRALAYQVQEARTRLKANELYDIRTTAGRQIRAAVENDPIGRDVLATLPAFDFDTENAALRTLLASPPYDVIAAEWEARKHKNWYALFDGPRTIRGLADHLGKTFQYVFLYSDWSGRLHAARTLRNLGINSREPNRQGCAIRPIRHPEGIDSVYNFAQGAALEVGLLLSQEYLSMVGQDDLRGLYLAEIRPITEKVRTIKIRADWC